MSGLKKIITASFLAVMLAGSASAHDGRHDRYFFRFDAGGYGIYYLTSDEINALRVLPYAVAMELLHDDFYDYRHRYDNWHWRQTYWHDHGRHHRRWYRAPAAHFWYGGSHWNDYNNIWRTHFSFSFSLGWHRASYSIHDWFGRHNHNFYWIRGGYYDRHYWDRRDRRRIQVARERLRERERDVRREERRLDRRDDRQDRRADRLRDRARDLREDRRELADDRDRDGRRGDRVRRTDSDNVAAYQTRRDGGDRSRSGNRRDVAGDEPAFTDRRGRVQQYQSQPRRDSSARFDGERGQDRKADKVKSREVSGGRNNPRANVQLRGDESRNRTAVPARSTERSMQHSGGQRPEPRKSYNTSRKSGESKQRSGSKSNRSSRGKSKRERRN